MGFENVSAFESDSLTFGDVMIHKTKAIHGDSEEVVKKMGEVCGYVFEAAGEKRLYLAADTIYCTEVELTIRKYQPEVIILNCCEATTPIGRLIMNLSDVEKVCQEAPQAVVIASHLDSVNHALLTRKDIIEFAKPVTGTRVPAPACFAMRSKTPMPVRIAVIKIIVTVDITALVFPSVPSME